MVESVVQVLLAAEGRGQRVISEGAALPVWAAVLDRASEAEGPTSSVQVLDETAVTKVDGQIVRTEGEGEDVAKAEFGSTVTTIGVPDKDP